MQLFVVDVSGATKQANSKDKEPKQPAKPPTQPKKSSSEQEKKIFSPMGHDRHLQALARIELGKLKISDTNMRGEIDGLRQKKAGENIQKK